MRQAEEDKYPLIFSHQLQKSKKKNPSNVCVQFLSDSFNSLWKVKLVITVKFVKYNCHSHYTCLSLSIYLPGFCVRFKCLKNRNSHVHNLAFIKHIPGMLSFLYLELKYSCQYIQSIIWPVF